MSQYPPQGNPQGPYGNPPQGYGPPPGAPGYPPQGQPQYSLQPATKTSAAAVTSLVCGILGFCTFGVTAIVAIITGAIGLSATKNPTVKGRGMAITGLVLGLLTLIGWGGFYYIKSMISITPAQSALTTQFVSDMTAGKLDAAQTACTANVNAITLQSDSAQMASWGGVQSSTIIGITVPGTPAGTMAALDVVKFNNGTQHNVTLTIVNDSSGAPKIDSVQLQ